PGHRRGACTTDPSRLGGRAMVFRLFRALALFGSLVGCATLETRRPDPPSPLVENHPSAPVETPALPSHPPTPETPSAAELLRARIVERAQRKLGRVRGQGDCVQFVRAVFREAGVELPLAGERGDNAVTALYRAARTQGRAYVGASPEPGDIAFFRETY